VKVPLFDLALEEERFGDPFSPRYSNIG